MTNVTCFVGFSRNQGEIPLTQFLHGIRDGRSAQTVNAIRQAMKDADPAKAEQLKKTLPGYTISATFAGARRMENLSAYNRLIILDIDKLDADQVDPVMWKAADCPLTLACFRSPSAYGVKIIVCPVCSHPLTVANHRVTFRQTVETYEELLGVCIDPSGKDPGRLCFDSYDPDMYISPRIDAMIAAMDEQEGQKDQQEKTSQEAPFTQMTRKTITNKLGASRRQTNRVATYEPGNRNNYIYLFSHYCRRKNLPPESVIEYARKHFNDIHDDEMLQTIQSAYNAPLDDKTGNDKKRNADRLPPLHEVEKHMKEYYTLRYNVITQRLEVKRKKSKVKFQPVDERILHTLWCEVIKAGIPCRFLTFRIVLYSHFVPGYNPFEDYFYNLPPWDGVTDHIAQVASTVTTTRPALWLECFRKWIVAMVACALVPEIINHTVLVFCGPQGVGKTSWCVNLIPPALKNYIHSGPADPHQKDIRLALTECILINLDELGALGERELNQLKEMITTPIIRERRAYGRDNETYPRCCSFTASANTVQVLSDLTGARRFLCFETIRIDYLSPINHAGLYAQALALFRASYKFWFDGAEIETLHLNNENFRIQSPEEELFFTYFRLPKPGDTNVLLLSTSEVLQSLNYKAPIHITRQAANNLSMMLRKHGFEQVRQLNRRLFRVVKIDEEEVDRQRKEQTPPKNNDSQIPEDQTNISFD